MTSNNPAFQIIQGGMGVGTSSARLANTISRAGELGVVSGTALDESIARRLQKGDSETKHAVEQFPHKDFVERFLAKYWNEKGKGKEIPFRLTPMINPDTPQDKMAFVTIGNFAEVFLAKKGHSNPVGINYLEKIQTPHLASIYGAMLARVDYIIMGAGIPDQVPRVLDAYANGSGAIYNIDVKGLENNKFPMQFSPKEVFGIQHELERPQFFPIITLDVLAMRFEKKIGGADGYVIERHIAGGHNTPPRGKGEEYTEKDEANLEKISAYGKPFFLAGGFGKRGGLKEALGKGASGIQIGSLFALSEESGIETKIKAQLIEELKKGNILVETDFRSSPTGFPFKVARINGTISESDFYEKRPRICDAGYLRHFKINDKGRIIGLCPSEPINSYLAKGGSVEDTNGRKCLCNGLFATIRMPQIKKDGYIEPPLLTLGDEVNNAKDLLNSIKDGETSYPALAVLEYVR